MSVNREGHVYNCKSVQPENIAIKVTYNKPWSVKHRCHMDTIFYTENPIQYMKE